MWIVTGIAVAVGYVVGFVVRGVLESSPEIYDSTRPDSHIVLGKTTGEAMEQAKAMFPFAHSISITSVQGRPDLWLIKPRYE